MTRVPSADEIIRLLGLQPHPEGGHYCQTFRDDPRPGSRERFSAIYFLLRVGERSHWHRIDTPEIWHFHAGAPLALRIAKEGAPVETLLLGSDVTKGERPQGFVPVGAWQSAESLGAWTLVGCTVAPGFRFEGFELAPLGWEPESPGSPEPVIEIATDLEFADNHEEVLAALDQLAAEDPSLRVTTDAESGQLVLAGTSELHLDSIVGRLQSALQVRLALGQPQVRYRQTITQAVEIDFTHKRQTRGAGEFARVKIRFEPLDPGSGFEFLNDFTGRGLPEECVVGIRTGVVSALKSGPLTGLPVVDIKATLTDGAYHEIDSSPLAFEIAGRAALREGVMAGRPVILEPIMRVEISAPSDFAELVAQDLKSRRANDLRLDKREGVTLIAATAPFANILGYQNALRSITKGRGLCTMTFSHYAPVPSPPDDDHFRPAVGMRV